MVKVSLLLSALLVAVSASRPCVLRSAQFGLVCVCNATYCDTLDDDQVQLNKSDPNQIIVITTSRGGLRFQRTEGSWADNSTIVVPEHEEAEPVEYSWLTRLSLIVGNLARFLSTRATIKVDDSITFQKMMGFGGALTGSVAYLLQQVNESLQDFLLDSYYSDKTGIGYNFLRISIGGSDYDLEPWAYNETPRNDKTLSNFTQLDPRDLVIVSYMKKMQKIADLNLNITAAAWGCPKWMRSPERRSGPGVLKPEYYQTWADYHLRYLQLMKAEGIDIWGISTGNEPMNGIVGWITSAWMNVGWMPLQVANFLADNLGPTIRNSEFRDIEIMAVDDQRSLFPWYFDDMVSARPDVLQYTTGLAVHSYSDASIVPHTLDMASDRYPDKFILNTEGSIGNGHSRPVGPHLGAWNRAALYTDMYMQSLSHMVAGWIDWNLMLDEKGGPNYADNYVDSPVVVNATAGEVYKQPMFYTIGHFSKFIRRGSVRIHASSDWGEVNQIAFLRSDNSIAVLLHNKHIRKVEVTIKDAKRGEKTLHLPAQSMTTVVYPAGVVVEK